MLSVIIPWCNRLELSRCIRDNYSWLDESSTELIIINCSGRIPDLLGLIPKRATTRMKVIDMAGAKYFNKAACLNTGITASRGETVLTLDADVVIEKHILVEALSVLPQGQSFITIDSVEESAPHLRMHPGTPYGRIARISTATRIDYDNGNSAFIEHSIDRHGTRSGPGLLLVAASHLRAIDGYNSALTGWGYEDVDVQLRLQLLLNLTRVSMGRALHVSHGLAHNAAQSSNNNRGAAWTNYASGRLSGTLAADSLYWSGRIIEIA